jgi:hypothetical protein
VKIKALKEFKSDEQLEEEGKWTTITDGVEFKIRRMRSKTVSKARDRIYGPYERAMGPRKKELPEAVELQCTVNLLSEAVIADWRGEGMVDDSDQPIPFTVDNCKAVLSDPETGKDLRATIITLALDGEHFAPDSEEATADEGNSSSASNGTSGTAAS